MSIDAKSSRVQFINGDDGSEIAAQSLRIVLPDGQSFTLEAKAGRDGGAVFMIDPGTPQDQIVKGFSIEPGAVNLFTVRVFEHKRR